MSEILTSQQIAQARTLVGPLTARMLVMMCDSHEQLRTEREMLREELERLYGTLDAWRKTLEDCLDSQSVGHL